MAKHVLVIGATLLDTKGKPVAGLAPAMSNPAEIRSTRGGTARNGAGGGRRSSGQKRCPRLVGPFPSVKAGG